MVLDKVAFLLNRTRQLVEQYIADDAHTFAETVRFRRRVIALFLELIVRGHEGDVTALAFGQLAADTGFFFKFSADLGAARERFY
jgi:hypothetical protein